MNKVIIMCGLPGSGKSTLVSKLQKDSNFIRINRDCIREMIGLPYSKDLEENVIRAGELRLFGICRAANYNPIIDDTNLNRKTFEGWIRECHANGVSDENIKIYFMDVPLSTCINRDYYRDKGVGEKVITDMYERNKDFIEELRKNPNVIRITG